MLDPKFEDVAADEQSAIRSIHRSCEDLSTDHDWHFHPQFELTWFISSSGTRYVADNIERYQPGDLVVSGPNLPHCWRNDMGDSSNDKPEWITIQFTPAALGAGLLELPEAAPIRRLLDHARGGLAFDSAGRLVGPLLHEIAHAQGLTRVLRLLEALHILSGIPQRRLAMTDYHGKNVLDQSLLERLDRVMCYVTEHFRDKVSQADLSRELDLSPTAFSKFVRGATGTTFTELIKRARINEACRMLAHTEKRITDIALDCGYAHTSHFDHHFQEMKGITPGEYRKRMTRLAQGTGKNKTTNVETAV
jgi:AraC-like DNA-binding protein